ncbi:MAG: type I DNA topoisomerase [Vicingaceae bacterium]
MSKNLVIVESPAKAKTIEKFLGKDYTVKSCFGHIRDLAGKNLSIDIENGFKPNYEIPTDKKKVVQELKKLAKEADLVWLASDEDREGEAISWHLSEVLNVDEKKLKRIVFHEITKNAIESAVQNPRTIDLNLVNAQQARRVIDRLVGYEVSPVLWKKVKPNLSAGRVQSVAVRLIAEREKEIRNFEYSSNYRLTGLFMTLPGQAIKADLVQRHSELSKVHDIMKNLAKDSFSVAKVDKKPATKSPAAPFTTSTLQQEASRKLGFSVSQTMSVAQKLYEAGNITYMRTDSVNLSSLAVNASKDEITKNYGSEYSKSRNFSTKTKGAQEAHEAIRPTYMGTKSVEGSSQEQKLYDLIWKRTIASQMSEAKLERTTIEIEGDSSKERFQAKGEVLKFDGFLKVYLEGTDQEDQEEEDGLLPAVKVGEKLNLDHATAIQKFTQHPARYTEASLVKKLEELGIGRPSTYAPTISTIQRRGYVVKENRDGNKRDYVEVTLKNSQIKEVVKQENHGFEKNKLFPTDIGMVVTEFLTEHFDKILSYDFTAKIEEQFDSIADGKQDWNEMIAKFYSPFHKNVESTLDTAERASGERLLGKDPVSGRQVIVRLGRFGPLAQIGSPDDEEKPKYASLLTTQSIETLTLEEALELFKLPRIIGKHNDQEISASIGRFGPYVKYEKTFASIPKDSEESVFSISLEKAIELIEARLKSEKEKFIADFGDENIQVLNGRYGPYIKFGKKNFRIPKGTDPKKLSLEDCKAIIDQKK